MILHDLGSFEHDLLGVTQLRKTEIEGDDLKIVDCIRGFQSTYDVIWFHPLRLS